MDEPTFSVIYCALTGRMRVMEGAPAVVRNVADEWARSVPGNAVHVLTPDYTARAPKPLVTQT